MIEYILGNYLVSEGRISKEQFQEVLAKQKKVRVKLGLIAVAEGLMTTAQADDVNLLQMTQDKRFGDIAIENGYLTNEQVGNLLKLQGNTYLTFIQTLIDSELLKMEDVDLVMEDFRKANGFSPKDVERMKTDDVDAIVSLYLPVEAMKFEELAGIAVRTMLRCIDDSVYVEKAAVVKKADVQAVAFQTIEGATDLMTGFAENQNGMTILASAFAKEAFTEVNDDVLDAAGEFLNCINGLYASAQSYKGVTMELLPPEFHMDSIEVECDTVCMLPVCIKDSKVFFIIAE